MKAAKLPKSVLTFIRDNYYYHDGEIYTNNKMSGYKDKPLGTMNGVGYLQVTVRANGAKGKRFAVLVHRIIWYLEKGNWPDMIDHIDRDPLNNLIENLRECTASQNHANRVARGVYKKKEE